MSGVALVRGNDRLRQWALVALAATLVAAALRAVVAFEHGIWLIAYLGLVGFLAPLLLDIGERRLTGERLAQERENRQAALWACGTIAVPVGVFAGARLGVVIGSVALLIVLAEMAATALAQTRRSSQPSRRAVPWAHLGLILFLGASVAVGVLLAWDEPWLVGGVSHQLPAPG